ncbi:MAG: PAS domain S-box protein [Epsilonproteobacteria bacterium]|nr:PAS domain S-box protein [Campylobacterota bacterium]
MPQTTYQAAIENSNIVSKTDIDGIITFANDEFCKIFEYRKEELIGQNHNIVRHPSVSKASFSVLWDIIKGEKRTYKATVKNLTKSGKTVYLNTTITPILDEDGNIIEFIAIRYDVTKEWKLKQDLVQKDKELEALNRTLEARVNRQTAALLELNQTLEARIKEEVQKNREKQKILFWQSRMASLGQMLGNIAHQWRQPLTELSLGLFNMRKAAKAEAFAKMDHYYKDAFITIENMSQTIEDFSNFFNPHKPKKKFFLHTSVEESLQITDKLLHKNSIHVEKSYAQVEVFGISNELAQVMINLIQNAVEAFEIKRIKHKKIWIDINADSKNASIVFRDNAGGIEGSLLEKIFEPYFTTKHQSNGTGLGLFMSKMIIEKGLNGTMCVENISDGLVFYITIPLEV